MKRRVCVAIRTRILLRRALRKEEYKEQEELIRDVLGDREKFKTLICEVEDVLEAAGVTAVEDTSDWDWEKILETLIEILMLLFV